MSNHSNPTNELNVNSISVLIEPAREGESASREQLFAELRGYLELIANRNMDPQVKQKAGTSDIIQSSFLKIVEKFDQFQGESSGELKAWIKTIVANEVNGVRRSYKAEKRDMDREVSLSPSAPSQNDFELTDGQLTPSSDALRNEQRKKIHEVLARLSPDDAMVIKLRNLEALSFREIGKRMNRSEQAASQLWYRAMLKFEEKLRAAGEFPSE